LYDLLRDRVWSAPPVMMTSRRGLTTVDKMRRRAPIMTAVATHTHPHPPKRERQSQKLP
jgi:hypothetical protein